MNKEDKLNDELMERFEPLLKDMENRTYDMAKLHDNTFLTLCGFLIATSGIIITADSTTNCIKILLVISIITLVVGLSLSNNLNAAQTLKFKKSINTLLKMSECNSIEEKISIGEEANKYMRINKKDIVFNYISNGFQNIGVILFLVGLIIYIC